jgi:predicted nucleic acid-binding protein
VIVLDASAISFALLDEGTIGDRCRAALRADSQWIVPEHWLIEVLSVIRGNLGDKITAAHAEDAAAAAAEMNPVVAHTRVIASRIWELRNNLTTYDAAYAATAEHYRCALVTTDSRLARATGIRCPVTLIS